MCIVFGLVGGGADGNFSGVWKLIIFFFLFSTGPEYGTMEAAWKGILTEADRLADVHLKVKENLCAGEIQQIKTWQKDNYHKVSVLFFLCRF